MTSSIRTSPGTVGSLRFHNDARQLAIEQTRHEWCRLLSLVEREHGDEAVKVLFDELVANPEEARAACSKDVALIIDSTGSMRENDPGGLRLEAAKAFIDTANIGDRISVIRFADSASTLSPLREITSNADRNALKSAVDGIGSYGSTNINTGLNTGFQELQPKKRPINMAILLTDGGQTDGPYYEASHKQYADKGWPIYTLGLGPDTNPALLEGIADATGGKYYALTSNTQLTEIFRDLSVKASGQNSVLNQKTTVKQGESKQFAITIGPSSPTASFFASWPTNDVSLRLVSPSGVQINANTNEENVVHRRGNTYESYSIDLPEPGAWKINLVGVTTPTTGVEVNLNVAVGGVMYRTSIPTLLFPTAPCFSEATKESNNVSDAAIICNQQPIGGQVSNADKRDVFKIKLDANKRIIITLTGTGGDADLYLYNPATADVTTAGYAARSASLSSNETLQYTPTQQGYWYIVVYSYSSSTTYSLNVNVSS